MTTTIPVKGKMCKRLEQTLHQRSIKHMKKKKPLASNLGSRDRYISQAGWFACIANLQVLDQGDNLFIRGVSGTQGVRSEWSSGLEMHICTCKLIPRNY